MKLNESVALVTGAGRGIGRVVAMTLAAQGSTVVLAARTGKDLDAVRAEIEAHGGKAVSVPVDITQDDQVEKLFKEVATRFRRLDVLVNNAGSGRFAPVRDLAVAEFDAMWKLNVRALFLCTQHALKLMEPNKNGVIVNVSSLAGKNAFVGGAAYSATKWALMGFSKTLMLEVRDRNIRVITICPGSVDTSFSPQGGDPKRSEKILHPQDVADTILAAMILPERAMVSEIDIRPTNPK
jgi:3-oxoacyl-[acyl-carrier protein] reductase